MSPMSPGLPQHCNRHTASTVPFLHNIDSSRICTRGACTIWIRLDVSILASSSQVAGGLSGACKFNFHVKCSSLVLSPSAVSNSHVPLACSNAQVPLVLSHPAISPGDRSSKPYTILSNITCMYYIPGSQRCEICSDPQLARSSCDMLPSSKQLERLVHKKIPDDMTKLFCSCNA